MLLNQVMLYDIMHKDCINILAILACTVIYTNSLSPIGHCSLEGSWGSDITKYYYPSVPK